MSSATGAERGGDVCPDCEHVHTPTGCTGDPSPSDIWAGVSPSACDCPGSPADQGTPLTDADSEVLRRIIDGAFGTDAAHGLIAHRLIEAGWLGPKEVAEREAAARADERAEVCETAASLAEIYDTGREAASALRVAARIARAGGAR